MTFIDQHNLKGEEDNVNVTFEDEELIQCV